MHILFFLSFMVQVYSQLISPCPRLFKYEPRGSENDRWYGTVTLVSDSELSGVWLRLIFDKPSIQLGNWFGEVVTTDNKEYLIKNRNHKLLANTPYNIRFYIKHNPGETPPQLIMFRLNAKTVCPENGAVTENPATTGHLITSSVLSTTSKPSSINNGGSFVRPGGAFNHQLTNSEEDDDFFQGDFAIFNKPKPSTTSLDAACGTVVMPPRPLITHGQATHEGEFPWHAALYHAKGIDLTYICGASLVTRYHLVTVAHCVTKRKSQEALDPDSLVVYLGKYYLKRWSNAGIQDKHVSKITVHPKYNAQTFNNDIAVIKLASPVEITNYVRPVCLWDEGLNLQAVVSKAGTVVGWGFDENGRVTEQLTKAKMPVVSQETCIYSFPDFYSRFTSSKTYCAGFKNGTSVCNGDSGGGMVFPKSNTNPNNPIWQLRGLVSISVALQNQLKCDSSHYVVFTDVAKYLDWIRASLN
ncbi:limulus clotting factor C-like [Asbolus verrucosus]|uniref:Limulus clotting factor C-like n=1 Tax=Asbolus verrucosus TaxID=1661398 RepID=A0A482VQT5_ASBVE|nr:limulus clotting factor C-like [Asbolus verrucosus]